MSTHRDHILLRAVLLFAVLPGGWIRADGGMFFAESQDLAQNRQQVVMAIQSDRITYVLQTTFEGSPTSFAWVIPVPAQPQDVVAHADSRLFDRLAAYTTPTFYSYSPSGIGCACADAAGGVTNSLVQIEAQGHAGIYDWTTLSSTGSDALLNWLQTNGYNVPTAAAPVLDRYIQQDMYFIAIRVSQPAADARQTSDAPPIQFTVLTTQRFYPMAISRISSAPEVEVVLYVLGTHRAQGVGIPNVTIDPAEVVADYAQPSGSNYETLFRDQIAAQGGVALVTEHVGRASNLLADTYWPQAPAGVLGSADTYLTRLRTVLAPTNMNFDITLGDASTDDWVLNWFQLQPATSAAAGVAASSVVVLMALALCSRLVRRSAAAGRREMLETRVAPRGRARTCAQNLRPWP